MRMNSPLTEVLYSVGVCEDDLTLNQVKLPLTKVMYSANTQVLSGGS